MTTVESTIPATASQRPPGDLLEAVLAESRELTAVERFAKAHDAGEVPAQAKHYHDLIPTGAPGEGQQYAFDIDLDACSGCKACVSACHHLNGLETSETWRWVGQLSGLASQATRGLPVIQHVTTACHHCVDPGCLKGCPTNAYEKDPDTGIVRHLDDQCFGCQYCTMACPYEVPQYSKSKGIVRKCDMCHGRLAAGEAPACVQACPNQAIRIAVVDTAETVAKTDAGEFLPDSPPSQLTHPTTVYRSQRGLPADAIGFDYDHAEPQHAHLPLVVMLVLTQMSVGAVAIGSLLRWLGGGLATDAAIVLGAAVGQAGLAAATLHLGRPHLAFRAALGWRHSWLSREALIFGAYAATSVTAALFAAMPVLESLLPRFAIDLLNLVLPAPTRPAAEALAMLSGAAGIFCSAMIYVFTGREFWLGGRTFGKFFGTAAVLGFAGTLAAATAMAASSGAAVPAWVLWFLSLGTIASTFGKLWFERSIVAGPHQRTETLRLTAKLLDGPLSLISRARVTSAAIGGTLLPLLTLAVDGYTAAVLALIGFALSVLGELAARAIYFSAVVPLRMPGGLKS